LANLSLTVEETSVNIVRFMPKTALRGGFGFGEFWKKFGKIGRLLIAGGGFLL